MLPRDAVSSVRGVLPVMARVDEQEVPSVGEINVPKRKLKDILHDFKTPSRPCPKLDYAYRLREDPRGLFNLFIANHDFEDLARYTNLNASLQHPQVASQHSHPRPWKDTNGAELKIWLG